VSSVLAADRLVPRAALVVDFNAETARSHLCADGEGSAWPARMAVRGGVAGQFGQAQDGVIGCPGAVQDGGQEPACLADVPGGGGKGAGRGW